LTEKELPYYNYLKFLLKYRILLLVLIFSAIIFSATFIKEGFVYNDKALWLNGSKEYSKLLKLKYPSLNVEQVVADISVDGWSTEAVDKLKRLQKELLEKEGVAGVNSLFEQKSIINNVLNDEQSMMEIVSLVDEDDETVYKAVLEEKGKFKSFVDGNKVTFYLLTSGNVDLDHIKSSYPLTKTQTTEDTHFKDVVLFSILFIILIASFSIAFKSILPSILGVVFITSTTIATVALFQLISAVQVTHISIVILSVTVSVMDFVYLYYKWHLIQGYRHGPIVLYRVITKTVIPIFWTTFVSIVGIGSLVFVDSQILYSMGMNVILSSLIGFILSFTMLPMMLSFFSQKNPQIVTKNSAIYFARKEAAYHKNGLQVFILVSVAVFIYSLYSYLTEPLTVSSHKNTNQIHIALTEEGLTQETLLELQNIQNLLKGEFNAISSFDSAYNEIRKLYLQEHPGEHFNLHNVDVDSYAFMFDLYDITRKIMANDHLTLIIYLNDISEKPKILNFLRDESIMIQDLSSLLDMAKTDSIHTLFYVIFFTLSLIVVAIMYITRMAEFSRIALVVNMIPLIWFFAAIMLFDIALSTEMLVAMIITVALSSDATFHFIFYYHNQRHKPRSSVKALESSFVYIGTPLGMGNIILASTFVTLIFIPDQTISHIGIFSAILVTLSLIVDLFVLPVLFVNRIRNNSSVQGFYHGQSIEG